jgi:SNF2 family DNA or RNA helicase
MEQQDFLSGYNWPCPPGLSPFLHQKETAAFLSGQRKAFCFNEQGTGKTASVIWATDYLMKMGLIRRVLIICPLSIMHSAWQQDLFKFAVHRRVDVAYGSATKRKEIIRAGAEYVIINFDGVSICKAEIIAGGFDLIVVDEASAYKNAQTDRWKTLRDVMKHVKGLWMLTGTPAAQSPVDAYGLAKLVNPDGVPPFYGQFRDQVMYPVTQYRWVPKPAAQSIVHRVLQPAIRFEKRQCLDLPEVTFADRDAPMTPQQIKYYKKLKTDMLMEAAGEEISAVNAAVKLNKLLQIACGSVYTDTGEVVDFDASNRLRAVTEVIDESSNKVLVFVPFTHTIKQIHDYLGKQSITSDVINGEVPVHKRTEIVKRFQEQADPKVLIIQPQAASHGLTLTAADTVVWYAPVTSVETYLQANARIDRPGQKNAMTVVHIKGSPIEARLYALLRDNISNHAKIVELYKQEMSEGT